ncbi:protein phosphatase methylesterase 1 isoform X1 [Diorhabda sublineata]|uniref:protein phosphatase methylesterase 1 isoform X1 n=1 Tax=Diorhabda sublineata TaxID=1163346 RepID=UPI0024E0C97E|nr:protein phosphatase methylesterase 1 isoform X1 [Diorhabda sublineata]
MSELRKSILKLQGKRPGKTLTPVKNYTPIKWTEYFEKQETVEITSGKFHIYTKGFEGPILLCLHGGGYSGLTWALFAEEVSKLINCRVIAIDLRGHGNTSTINDADLSLEMLSQDVVEIASKLTETNPSPIVLLGHSMGGAVAVEAAHHIDCVVGLCVIDVVEGTALDALSSMQSILRGRPSHFKSLPHAIQWCYKGGQTHNLEAARVSMPGQIVSIKTGKLAADDCDNIDESVLLSSDLMKGTIHSPLELPEVIENEEDEAVHTQESDNCVDCGKPPLSKNQKIDLFKNSNVAKVESGGPQYTWRIDLSKTEKFWAGWFKGLSQKFLDLRIPKLLLLANIHGLDTALTVGQMQGKFQLQVLAKSGHAIHEDQPHHVAEIVSGYLVKQRIAIPKSNFVHASLPAC